MGKEMLVHLGGALSPFHAWLISRGLVTLPERMERHCRNAAKVAQFLEAHPKVTRVLYPALPSHPHHALAQRQMAGFGGMVIFQLKGGLGAAITLAEKIRVFQYATSLGHAHCLLFYYPTDMYVDAVIYLDAGQKARIRKWMGDGIVRASIGLEDADDLIADLDQALRSSSFKGLVGPLAYRMLKAKGEPVQTYSRGMIMPGKILVTGALGNVGAEVVKHLQEAGFPFRAADRDVTRLRERFGADVETVTFDFTRRETYVPAFDGVEKMFLIRPPQIANIRRDMLPALDAAKAAGVKQVAFLSLIGIERARFVPHYKVEAYLRASGQAWTFLRCSFFMQNLNTTHRVEIRDRDEIFVPVGSARTSFIDVRDIAAVATVAMTEPGHEGQAYDLTGSEALDYWQVAGIMSQILGRKITYRNPNPLTFLASHVRHGTPLMFALVMTGLYLSTRNGMAERVTGEVERLTGRRPIAFAQYVRDYRDAWCFPSGSERH